MDTDVADTIDGAGGADQMDGEIIPIEPPRPKPKKKKIRETAQMSMPGYMAGKSKKVQKQMRLELLRADDTQGMQSLVKALKKVRKAETAIRNTRKPVS